MTIIVHRATQLPGAMANRRRGSPSRRRLSRARL